MKTCPVCHAKTFVDAEICFGCMHRFAASSGLGETAREDAAWEPDEGLGKKPAAAPMTFQKTDIAQMPAVQKGAEKDELRPVRDVVREPADERFAPSAGRGAAGGGERLSEASYVVETPSFDGAGWIVRFELPERATYSTSDTLREADARDRARREAPGDMTSLQEAVWPLVISVQPAARQPASQQIPRERIASGRHAPVEQVPISRQAPPERIEAGWSVARERSARRLVEVAEGVQA